MYQVLTCTVSVAVLRYCTSLATSSTHIEPGYCRTVQVRLVVVHYGGQWSGSEWSLRYMKVTNYNQLRGSTGSRSSLLRSDQKHRYGFIIACDLYIYLWLILLLYTYVAVPGIVRYACALWRTALHCACARSELSYILRFDFRRGRGRRRDRKNFNQRPAAHARVYSKSTKSYIRAGLGKVTRHARAYSIRAQRQYNTVLYWRAWRVYIFNIIRCDSIF